MKKFLILLPSGIYKWENACQIEEILENYPPGSVFYDMGLIS